MKRTSKEPQDFLTFKTRLQPKKRFTSNVDIQPVPIVEDPDKLFSGIFTGLSVEVEDADAICSIYNNGFYGKGSQSRGAPYVVRAAAPCHSKDAKESRPATEESLVLMLEEAFFLAYMVKCLKISDLNGTPIEMLDFLKRAEKVNPSFLDCLAAYIYAKSKTWVVKSGLKFGGEFLLYYKGPQFYHASFIVFVKTPEDTEYLMTKNMKAMQRVAETSAKDVLILEVKKPEDFSMTTLEDISKIHVSETIIRRFNISAYVQQQDSD